MRIRVVFCGGVFEGRKPGGLVCCEGGCCLAFSRGPVDDRAVLATADGIRTSNWSVPLRVSNSVWNRFGD